MIPADDRYPCKPEIFTQTYAEVDPMTAPDPGLTDLIAAEIARHRLRYGSEDAYNGERWLCTTCPWLVEADTGSRPNATVIQAHANHVAERLKLVVEQHTNGRIAEYIKQLESERETLTSMCSELESIRDEQAARIAELETLQRVDQDLFVQTLAIANQRKERAEKAGATVARVIEGAQMLVESFQRVERGGNHLYDASTHRCADNLALLLAEAQGPEHLRAALEGEQK